jgi:hypothetical protein
MLSVAQQMLPAITSGLARGVFIEPLRRTFASGDHSMLSASCSALHGTAVALPTLNAWAGHKT